MVGVNASRLVACTLLLLSLPITVFARAGLTTLHGYGNILSHLNPQPVQSVHEANLAIRIIFAAISFLQLWHAAFALLYKRTPEQDYRLRVPFVFIMVLTLLTSIIAFVITFVTDYQGLFAPLLTAVLSFMEGMTPIFLYAGLFLLLAYRRSAQISPGTGQPVGFTAFGLSEGFIVGVLLLFMVAFNIANTAIIATPFDRITPDLNNLSENLYHPYLAASIALVFIIGIDSISLWVNRDDGSSPRQLLLFDNNVLLPMAAVIWPLLMVSVLFELADDITLSLFITQIDINDISFAGLLISGSTQIFTIAFALMFGFPVFKRNVGHVWEGKGPVIAA
ncbi:hypothetical protein AX17_005466 [Amanita inopinata Kibby_2008]|nr:hypothetical protein AX17_005620 [Amanita inopinata Kibby_2008]KAF8630246.1 hypothetical protein AX17_005466 [Amanita inopinata Kibby_2008]